MDSSSSSLLPLALSDWRGKEKKKGERARIAERRQIKSFCHQAFPPFRTFKYRRPISSTLGEFNFLIPFAPLTPQVSQNGKGGGRGRSEAWRRWREDYFDAEA